MKNILFGALIFYCQVVFAKEACLPVRHQEKIEGRYVFESITPHQARHRLVFKPEKKGHRVSIEADHAHSALNLGESYKLAFEPSMLCEDTYRVQQLRVVVQTLEGANPFWISSAGNRAAIKGKLLDRHAPLSDYAVF